MCQLMKINEYSADNYFIFAQSNEASMAQWIKLLNVLGLQRINDIVRCKTKVTS